MGCALSSFILDFWIFFNFAKPLSHWLSRSFSLHYFVREHSLFSTCYNFRSFVNTLGKAAKQFRDVCLFVFRMCLNARTILNRFVVN